MRLSRALSTAAIAGAILTTSLVAAGPASAADQNVTGTCNPTTGVYRGDNWLFYYLTSNVDLQLDYTWYTFSPALAASTHNNQNFYFWGGDAGTTSNSSDNLIRDGQRHTGQTDVGNFGSISGVVGKSYVKFTDIFDVPGASDPKCSVQTRTF